MKTFLFAILSVVYLNSVTFGQQTGNTTTSQNTFTFNFYEGTFDQALKEAAKKKHRGLRLSRISPPGAQ